MTFANLAAYQAAVAAGGWQTATQSKTIGFFSGFSRWASLWTVATDAGSTPSAAAVPSRTIAGALGQANADVGDLYLTAAQIEAGTNSGNGGNQMWVLCDRLSHTGGLVGNISSTQTTNLPTAALTRYTGGAGVFAALEIYSAVGASATTATVSYTNQAGTAGQVSPPMPIGATNNQEARRLLVVPLQPGDTGVRSVESVTLAATTGTAGNFGVTLFKPLYVIPQLASYDGFVQTVLNGGIGGGLPPILDEACLWWTHSQGTTTLTVPLTVFLSEA